MDSGQWASLGLMRELAKRSLSAPGPDLTVRQLVILLSVHLADNPPTVRALAAELGLKKPAITRALDVLEAQGLLARAPDDHDRRSVILTPTILGAEVLSSFAVDMGADLTQRVIDMGGLAGPKPVAEDIAQNISPNIAPMLGIA